MATKSVLITGCSNGGIGSSLAVAFQKRGLHVFATARSLSKMSHLAELSNITLLTLDVASASSVTKAAHDVAAQTAGTLDYLVNNAGLNYVSPTLDVNTEKAKEIFDVNFWGTLSCVQAFASLLISAKGTIINTSSILSLLNTPYTSIYCASKAAITIFDQVLRLEMAPLGVKVVTTITGSVATNINAEGSGFKLQPDSRYAEVEAQINKVAYGKDIPNQMSCEEYAEKVVGDILGGASGKIWKGGNATATRYLSALLPQSAIVRLNCSCNRIVGFEIKRAGYCVVVYLDFLC